MYKIIMDKKQKKPNKPLYKPFPAPAGSKHKFKVYVKNEKTGQPKLIGFGLRGMQDFRQHKDPKRRASYLARAKGIKDKQGNLTYKNKNSANYWAIRKLWAGP